MSPNRVSLHWLFLILLPIPVAWFGWSTAGAIAAVLVLLLWRWAISISGILVPERVPDIELETIAASHFAEKVRWCMDRLGIQYHERQVAGVLGVVFLGRTVPVLRVKTGIVRSAIGNSPDILRYLWGANCGVDRDQAAFLKPTTERLELEEKFDRYGVNLQVWVYHHLLDDKDLTIHAWGHNSSRIPAWQRLAIRILYPVLRAFVRRAFKITNEHYASAVNHIESTLDNVEQRLAEGYASISGKSDINYSDITFAAMTGLWLQPTHYGGGSADAVRIDRDRLPDGMRQDIEGWIEKYPGAVSFVSRLYENER